MRLAQRVPLDLLARVLHLVADIVLLRLFHGSAQFLGGLGVLLFAQLGDTVHLVQQLPGAFLQLLLGFLEVLQLSPLTFVQLVQSLAHQLLFGTHQLLGLGHQAFLFLQQAVGFALDLVRTRPRLQSPGEQVIQGFLDFLLRLPRLGERPARQSRVQRLGGVAASALRLLSPFAGLLSQLLGRLALEPGVLAMAGLVGDAAALLGLLFGSGGLAVLLVGRLLGRARASCSASFARASRWALRSSRTFSSSSSASLRALVRRGSICSSSFSARRSISRLTSVMRSWTADFSMPFCLSASRMRFSSGANRPCHLPRARGSVAGVCSACNSFSWSSAVSFSPFFRRFSASVTFASASRCFLAQAHQLLLHVGLLLVECQIEGVAADDTDLHLVTAAGFLVEADIVEIVGAGAQENDIVFLEAGAVGMAERLQRQFLPELQPAAVAEAAAEPRGSPVPSTATRAEPVRTKDHQRTRRRGCSSRRVRYSRNTERNAYC